MKIAIVGNSNCVFRNGFTNGVMRAAQPENDTIKNYSLGGSCCAFHIYTYHDSYAELYDCDLVILDSMIIDSFHWRRGIISNDELASLIEDMYALYSQLPGKVISILFPIKRYASRYMQLPTYKAHMSVARKYGVDVVDLYKLLPSDVNACESLFMQPSHIKTEIANEIGCRIFKSISGMAEKKQISDQSPTPYKVVKGEVFDGLEKHSVESSLFKASCYQLDMEVSLSCLAGNHLVGAMQWNMENKARIVVSGGHGEDVVQLRTRYAFFEVLYKRRKIDKSFVVRPGDAAQALTQQAAGKSRQAPLGNPQIIGLLIKSDHSVSANIVDRHKDMSGMVGNVFGV